MMATDAKYMMACSSTAFYVMACCSRKWRKRRSGEAANIFTLTLLYEKTPCHAGGLEECRGDRI